MSRSRVLEALSHWPPHTRAWPVGFKLSLMVMLGMLAMAGAIGTLMFGTANKLFEGQAHAELNRQNQAVASEINNLTERAAASLLIARHNQAFDRFYEAEASDDDRAGGLDDIQRTIVYLQCPLRLDRVEVLSSASPYRPWPRSSAE